MTLDSDGVEPGGIALDEPEIGARTRAPGCRSSPSVDWHRSQPARSTRRRPGFTPNIANWRGSSSWSRSSRSAWASGRSSARRVPLPGAWSWSTSVAVGGWIATRMFGISWIDGLEVREAPQFADVACAALGLLAILAANAGALLPERRQRTRGLMAPTIVICVFTVWTMMAASTHVHSHDEADHGTEVAGADHGHGDELAADVAGVADAAGAADEADAHAHDDASDRRAGGGDHRWPRPRRRTGTRCARLAASVGSHRPIDVSGVEGVTAEQEVRAVELIEDTLRELPKYADPAAAVAAGYTSIGDAGTGSEHYIKSRSHRGRRPARSDRSRVARLHRRTATSAPWPAPCSSPAPVRPTTRP